MLKGVWGFTLTLVLFNYAVVLKNVVSGLEGEASAEGASSPGEGAEARRAVLRYLPEDGDHHFTEEWVVHVPIGEEHARSVAEQNGFRFVRRLIGHTDHYLVVRDDHPTRSKRSADHHTNTLLSDERVHWAEQQVERVRVKRGFIPLHRLRAEAGYNDFGDDIDRKSEGYDIDERRAHRTKVEKAVHRSSHNQISSSEGKSSTFPTRDVLAAEQWYLRDDTPSDCPAEMDERGTPVKHPPLSLDVVRVWEKGYTGKGVTVTVLDDGLEWRHTDLIKNFKQKASWDLNSKEKNDWDPSPRYDPNNENKHGTRCAGEIAMERDNGKCGVGVAYNAHIGGVRMLDGRVTDRSECEAFGVGVEDWEVDVFSASWGPNDDGRTTEGPGELAARGLEHGITKGRGGRGVIYVWASGNGGGAGDNCDCDGYTSSIYTLSISSASQSHTSPWYAEHCPSTMATTYSSGAYNDQAISTTDLNDTCTTKHTGTSASAPLAAGVMALLLEANPDLTWRDVMWLVMMRSNYWALKDNKGWVKNGAGLMVNPRFGAGLLDALAMVEMAEDKKWQNAPDKFICTNDVKNINPKAVPQKFCGGQEVVVTITTTGCRGQTNHVAFLEHVQVYVNVTHNHRGNIAIYVKSPQGENATRVLSNRKKDMSKDGLKCWPFMSVFQWAEEPAGEWQITIQDNGGPESCGVVHGVELVLHGVATKPWIMKKVGRRTYGKTPNGESIQNVKNGTAACLKKKKQHKHELVL